MSGPAWLIAQPKEPLSSWTQVTPGAVSHLAAEIRHMALDYRKVLVSLVGRSKESAWSSFCIKGQVGKVWPAGLGLQDLSHLGWHRDGDEGAVVTLGRIRWQCQVAVFRTIEDDFSQNLSCSQWWMKNPLRAIKYRDIIFGLWYFWGSVTKTFMAFISSPGVCYGLLSETGCLAVTTRQFGCPRNSLSLTQVQDHTSKVSVFLSLICNSLLGWKFSLQNLAQWWWESPSLTEIFMPLEWDGWALGKSCWTTVHTVSAWAAAE